MFDPSKFDGLIKKAKEFDSIMGRYMNATGIPMIDSALKTLADTSKEAAKLLRILDDIKGDFKAMALEQAKMTAAELASITKFQKRRDLMDQILVNIKKQNKELAKQAHDSKTHEQDLKQRLATEQTMTLNRIKQYRAAEQLYKKQMQMAKTIDEQLSAEEAMLNAQDKINDAVAKYQKLQDKAQKAMDKEVEKQQKLKDLYLANKKAAAEVPGMKAANDRAEAAEQRARRMKKLMGFGGNIINPLMQSLGLDGLVSVIGKGLVGALGVGIGYVLKKTFDSYMNNGKAITNQGINVGQTNAPSMSIVNKDLQKEMLARGMVSQDPADMVEAQGTLANSLGTLNSKNQGETVANMMLLNKLYGMTFEETTKIFGATQRWGKSQKGVADDVYRTVSALSGKSGIPIGTVFKDIANNTEIFAKYAGRGLEAFTKSAIAARQYGISLQAASGFADSLVNDFEGALKMQATVQTFMPGMDFAGVTYASQFGTDKDVLDELHGALKNTGMKSLDQLPRSLRNSLMSQLGLSADQFQNILSGPVAGAKVESLSGPQETNKIMSEISTQLQQILQNGILATFKFAAGWSGFFTSPQGVSVNKAPTDMVHGAIHHTGGIVGSSVPTRAVSASTYSTAPRFHKGFMPDEVPSILQRGEAVLSHAQLAGLTQLMNLTQTIGSLGGSVQRAIPQNGTQIANRLFGGARVGQAQGMMGSAQHMMSQVSNAKNFLGGGTGGLMQAVGSILPGGAGGLMKAVSGGAGSLLSGGLGKLAGFALGGPIGGIAASLLGGKLGSVASIGSKAISGIGHALGGLFGHKKKAAPTPTPANDPLASLMALMGGGSGAPVPVGPNNVEKLLQELVSAVKEGKDVYLDGKKVGSTLASSLGRG
jgi:hypothetical protein